MHLHIKVGSSKYFERLENFIYAVDKSQGILSISWQFLIPHNSVTEIKALNNQYACL